jgi:uncharacterized protein YcnI
MRAIRRTRTFIAAAAATTLSVALGAMPAFAHMAIVTYGTTFTANATNVFYFRVPHGCADPDAAAHGNFNGMTNQVVINVPSTVTGVKPEQKPGWTVSVVRDVTTSAVTQITWSTDVNNALHDWTYGDFGVRATLNGVAGDVIPFQTEQICGFHDDGVAIATPLHEPWTGANAPKLTLVGANKVTSAADLADLKGRVIALETSVSGALSSIAGLVTSDATIGARIATAESAISSLNTNGRLGYVSAQKKLGHLGVVVDLPSTFRFKPVTFKVDGATLKTLWVNGAGDTTWMFTIPQSAGIRSGQKVEVFDGPTLVASGWVG